MHRFTLCSLHHRGSHSHPSTFWRNHLSVNSTFRSTAFFKGILQVVLLMKVSISPFSTHHPAVATSLNLPKNHPSGNCILRSILLQNIFRDLTRNLFQFILICYSSTQEATRKRHDNRKYTLNLIHPLSFLQLQITSTSIPKPSFCLVTHLPGPWPCSRLWVTANIQHFGPKCNRGRVSGL